MELSFDMICFHELQVSTLIHQCYIPLNLSLIWIWTFIMQDQIIITFYLHPDKSAQLIKIYFYLWFLFRTSDCGGLQRQPTLPAVTMWPLRHLQRVPTWSGYVWSLRGSGGCLQPCLPPWVPHECRLPLRQSLSRWSLSQPLSWILWRQRAMSCLASQPTLFMPAPLRRQPLRTLLASTTW